MQLVQRPMYQGFVMIIPKIFEFYESLNAPTIVGNTLHIPLEPVMTNLAISTTNADTGFDAEARRNAYNAAFHELGFGWVWETGCHLAGPAGERACLRDYLAQHQPHLLCAYDADFLVDAILAAKERWAPQMAAAAGRRTAIDWRELQQRQIGV